MCSNNMSYVYQLDISMLSPLANASDPNTPQSDIDEATFLKRYGQQSELKTFI